MFLNLCFWEIVSNCAGVVYTVEAQSNISWEKWYTRGHRLLLFSSLAVKIKVFALFWHFLALTFEHISILISACLYSEICVTILKRSIHFRWYSFVCPLASSQNSSVCQIFVNIQVCYIHFLIKNFFSGIYILFSSPVVSVRISLS